MTAELFEFPDEMRLVGIAAQVCELGVADAFGGCVVMHDAPSFFR